MEFLYFAVVGVLAGMTAALLGLGGGVIVVPYMVFFEHVEPQIAVGVSVVVVLLSTTSGAVGYIREKMACLDAAWKFALGTIPGALLGSYAAEFLKGRVFYIVFGILFLAISLNLYTKSKRKSNDKDLQVPEHYNWPLGVACAMFGGFIASILGIGGGVIHVPVMVYILKFPIKIAIATCSCIMAVSAVAGAASHAYFGHVLWIPAIGIGLGAIVGAQIGVKISKRIKSSVLTLMTSVLMLYMGIRFLLTAYQM